jgi:hypothetical protein
MVDEYWMKILLSIFRKNNLELFISKDLYWLYWHRVKIGFSWFINRIKISVKYSFYRTSQALYRPIIYRSSCLQEYLFLIYPSRRISSKCIFWRTPFSRNQLSFAILLSILVQSSKFQSVRSIQIIPYSLRVIFRDMPDK